MLLEGVIFHLDGVICRTDQFHEQAWKAGGFPAAGIGDARQSFGADFSIEALAELLPICAPKKNHFTT